MTELPYIETFEYDRSKREVVELMKQPEHFMRDGLLYVSAEDGSGFVDYYGEFRGGFPYIHPELEQWAEQQGKYWEWENPGCIVLVE